MTGMEILLANEEVMGEGQPTSACGHPGLGSSGGEGRRVGGVWVGSRLDQEGRESGGSDRGRCKAVASRPRGSHRALARGWGRREGCFPHK